MSFLNYTLTFLFFLLLFHLTLMCGGLLVLFWCFLHTVFFPLNAPIATHLCTVLKLFLISVPFLVIVMMFFARLFIWFCIADIFVWWRGRGRGRGARIRLQALIFIWVVASSLQRAVLFLRRRWWGVVCMVLLLLFLFHVTGLRRWFPCASIVSPAWLLTARVCVWLGWCSDMSIGGSAS